MSFNYLIVNVKPSTNFTRGVAGVSPELVTAIRHEYNATVEAVQRAQARALHLGELLLELRQELVAVAWEIWLQHRCPIPAGAARGYANEA